jgi:hypothetical protein
MKPFVLSVKWHCKDWITLRLGNRTDIALPFTNCSRSVRAALKPESLLEPNMVVECTNANMVFYEPFSPIAHILGGSTKPSLRPFSAN